MFSAKTSIVQSASVSQHRFKTWRAAMAHFALGMRDLEEQLPLPADRRVRDTTSARQKAAALRVDIDDLDLRLLQIWQQIRAVGGIKE